MTEVTTAFDLDAWLDSATRTERAVTVYGRNDLLADIDILEDKLRTQKQIPDEDRALGGDDSVAEIERQIDALYVQLGKSRLDLRVTTLAGTEEDEIRDQVKKDLKAEMDAAAKKARADAREECERAGVVAANDINSVLRNAAFAASSAVVDREVNLRILAKVIISPRMSLDNVRTMYTAIGDSQVALISAAYTRASNEAPKVVVPKSLKPSPSDDGAMSS